MNWHENKPSTISDVEATKHARSESTFESGPMDSMPNDSPIMATENTSDVWLRVQPNSASSGGMKMDQA